MNINRISCEQAHELMQDERCQVVDIRDGHSYTLGHPKSATLLDNDSVPEFISQADLTAPTLVFCYHGNSSQQATAFLRDQGFTDAHSVDGGFEMWRQLFPNNVEKG